MVTNNQGKTYEERYGVKMAKHLKEKRREFMTLNNCMRDSMETRKKSSLSHLGKIQSEATRLKNSLSKIGKNPKNMNLWIEKGIQTRFQKGQSAWNKGISPSEETLKKLIEIRKTRIFPIKDTRIEVKIQNFLKQLGITFLTHQYIREIEHGYQCDIMIPVQKGIAKKTIIECFGDYWHNYPYARELDIQRCNELRTAGWKVLVFWECEIKPMELNVLQEKL